MVKPRKASSDVRRGGGDGAMIGGDDMARLAPCYSSRGGTGSGLFGIPARLRGPFVDGQTGQNAAEIAQRLADLNAALVEPELADGPLVAAAALLHDRDGLPHFPGGLEVAGQDHRVGPITGVDRRGHLAARHSLGGGGGGGGGAPPAPGKQ